MLSARRTRPAASPDEIAAGTPSGDDSAGHGEDGEDARDGRGGWRLAALLGAAAVVAGSFGLWATLAAHNLRASAATANGALIDRAATRSVDRDVTHAVDTIFTYNYAHTATTRAAAQHLLTGRAIRQYNELFAVVERQAPKEKLVVTTKVTDVGVELLTGGRARALVFANQQDTRAGTGQTTYAGAMFAVTVVRIGGIWKIENIDTFTGSG